MNSLNKEILNFIKKAARKIRLNFVINEGLVGLKYLLALIYFLIIISLFFVIKNRESLILLIGLFGLVGIIVYGIIKGPDKKKIALILDSKGLDERLSTALEFLNEEDNISITQREDTVNHIRKFDFKKLKISINKKELLKSFAILLICILTMTIRTGSTIKANELRNFDIYKEDLIKDFEEEILKVEENEKISKEEKDAIKKLLEEVKEDILEALNKEELDKALERNELKFKEKKENIKDEKEKSEIESLTDRLFNKFNKEKKEMAESDINNLMNELVKNEEGKDIAESILSEDDKKLEEALAELKEDLKNMSQEELSKLSKALGKAGEKTNSAELKEALGQASKDVLKGSLNAGELKDAIKKTQKNSSEGKDGNDGSGEGEGQGNGEGQGSGQGQGQGQGQGSGQGQGNNGNGSGVGPNQGSNIGSEGEGEDPSGLEIFIPGRNVGNDENLQGNINEEGNSETIENENGINLDGEKMEYEKVVGDYTNSALDSINNSNMPEGLKNIIKDYFDGLN